MIPERVMRKIERCLALSNSTNGHEAGIALRQAQRLMAEYGVTEQDVALADFSDHVSKVAAGRTPPRYLDRLASLVNAAFGTAAVYSPRYSGKGWQGTFHFVGPSNASRVAAYAYTVLQRQLVSDRSAYLTTLSKRLKRTTKVRRGDAFAEAWVTGAREQVILVSVSDEVLKAIEEFRALEFGQLSVLQARKHGNLKRHDVAALHQGYRAGRQVKLHQAVEFTTERPESLTHG